MTEKSETFDMRWKAPMNSYGEDFRWVTAACEPAVDGKGRVTGIYGCITDIQSTKRSEMQILARNQALEKLKESENQFQSFLEAVPVAAVVTDPLDVMTFANNNWFEMTGFPHGRHYVLQTCRGSLEATSRTRDRSEEAAGKIRNPLSAVVHCADAISESLTEMDRLVWASEAQTIDRLHGQIKEALDAVNTIKDCTSHQRRIVDDILVLSKLDSNLLTVLPAPTKAMDIITGMEKMFEAEAKSANIDLTIQADESLGRLNIDWLLIDPGRINQILINLATNALKFTRNRTVRDVSIRMGVSERRPSEADLGVDFKVDFALSQNLRDSVYDTPEFAGSHLFLWFCVTDTGRGMTPDEKGRIFARFQQGSVRTYSEYGGSGLGLFISHSLVGLQGGEIGVATEAGVGSTFAFFVKTSRCAAPGTDSVGGTPVLSNGEANNLAKVENRISVLIVEDNLLNQKVLKKQLSKFYGVFTADHGQEALDFIETTRQWNNPDTLSQTSVDIILMDIEMPIMGGLECTKRIRSLEADGHIRNHIPIIAVSANARPEQIHQSLEAGMDDAITKPFRIPDLLPKIERLVKKARASASY